MLESLSRLEPIIKAATKKSEKELRYEKEVIREASNQPKQEVVEEKAPEVVVNNATMNLRTMREMKYEYTQLSNMSVDFISEKEVLEAIYNRVFEEKQESRKDTTREGKPHALILTSLTGHRKDAIQKDIDEKIPNGDSESIIHTYPKE